MPRGTLLTEREKGQIEAFSQEGLSQREIARRLKRSPKVIQNFLKNPNNYASKKDHGRHKKLSKRQERHVVRTASNSTASCNRIKHELDLDVSKTTIWRTLKRSGHIVRAKMNVAPRLKAEHKIARLEFARTNMKQEWKLVSTSATFIVN